MKRLFAIYRTRLNQSDYVEVETLIISVIVMFLIGMIWAMGFHLGLDSSFSDVAFWWTLGLMTNITYRYVRLKYNAYIRNQYHFV